jgi:thioredoxin reductase
MPWAALAIALGAGTSTLGGLSLFRRVRKSKPTRGPTAPLVPAQRVRLPQINASTCLGCYACVDACPFDVIEIQRYVALVARPTDCCGVVLCQQACPNGSLTIQEGAPIEERPHLDEHLESKDTPGVFVAGDLSGLPLIKNAIAQGARVVDRIHATLPSKDRVKAPSDDRVDLVIVGAGPAGLSASLRARELGLSYVTLEQGTVASSIQSFPRNKLVFDQPLHVPVEGELWLKESTKEELLGHWTRIVRARKLVVRERSRVTQVTREGGVFAVTTERGIVRGSRLLLAIGRRGTPRTLDCELAPSAVSRVSYALADARSFAGQRVVIVGLGDSAMEAAIALARQPDTKVTISYRGRGFTRGRARNVAEMKRLLERGDVRVAFESAVVRIDGQHIVLEAGGRHERVPYDHVLVLIGGTPSWQLVRESGVKLVAQLVETTTESTS